MATAKKKPTDVKKLISILETGIELEKKGLGAYLKFAHKTKSMTGKNMFIRLAFDELEHMKILEKIRGARLAGKAFRKPPLPMKEINAMLPKLREKQFLKEADDGLADIDALKTALEMEKKSANYFRKIAQQEKDPKIVDLAGDLAKWEEFHYDLLQGGDRLH
ncbi:MAG: ferritin family protein [Pseudomonadota bacterium]